MGKRPKHFDYDLMVIGSGAGGGIAAHMAVKQGKKVAIVEEEKIGGECPNYGCVPTKALLKSAELYREAQNAKDYGVRATSVNINYPSIKKWKDLAVKRTGTAEGDRAYAADGIASIHGHAHFLDPWTVNVGKKRFSAKHFIVATGTRNFVPPIEGLKKAGFITYREAIDLTKLPKSMLIIGGGAIGIEFAHIFNSFGSEVTVAEYAPRLIAREDPEASELIQAIFEQNGVDVLTGTEVIKIEKDRSKKKVTYKTNGKEHTLRVDEVLLATGKVPNTDLGLENAGVEYTRRGIAVNDKMQTTAKHIYAAGDVVGPYAFTHMASYQSRIAANNILHRDKLKASYHAVPRCIFTTPEMAAVGMTETQAKEKGIKIKTNAVPISIIGRSNVQDEDIGFVKVITSSTGVIIGATIIAPRAGEMIHELALAVQNGLTADDVAATIHAFPTWSEAVRIACAGV